MSIYPLARGNNERMGKRARDLEPPPDPPLSSFAALFEIKYRKQ
jgi:hypothetical protein